MRRRAPPRGLYVGRSHTNSTALGSLFFALQDRELLVVPYSHVVASHVAAIWDRNTRARLVLRDANTAMLYGYLHTQAVAAS